MDVSDADPSHIQNANGKDDGNVRDSLEKARTLWLQARSRDDLSAAEHAYRSIWTALGKKEDEAPQQQKEDSNSNKRQKLEEPNEQGDAADPQRVLAGEKLAMLLLQNGGPDEKELCSSSSRAKEAQEILDNLGYKCRLSRNILNYPTCSPSLNNNNKVLGNDIKQQSYTASPPCRIFDSFLNETELEILQRVFADRQSTYWTDHDYTVEPPSPYFSYVIPLQSNDDNDDSDDSDREILKQRDEFGFLGCLIQRILKQLCVWKPSLSKQCTHAELWAHNRPHATGHQLHFDSDNEGQGSLVRHPIVSSILYLSSPRQHSSDEEESIGGPSLITNQRRVGRHLATQGWLCPPKLGRLTAFDGRVLHGVIPGKGFVASHPSSEQGNGNAVENVSQPQQQQQRVTLMLAFWKRLQTRDHGSSKVGAARPFPSSSSWAKDLCQPYQLENDEDAERRIYPVDPIPVSHVYETIGGEPWTARMGMPCYDEIYQGF